MKMRSEIWIHILGDDPIWFQRGKPISPFSTPASNLRYFKTVSKARKMARGILNKYPEVVVVINRLFSKSGEDYDRSEQETWTKQDPKSKR